MSVQAGQVGWVFKRYAQIIDQWKAAIPELIDSNLEASSLKPTEISCVPTHLAIPKCVNKRLLCNLRV